MPENKDYMIHREELGSIQISEDVVATIAAGAAMDVENVTGLQGYLHILPSFQSSGKRYLVRKFKLTTNRDPRRKSRHTNLQRSK